MSTITFSNQSDTGISFLTHRNISMNIMSKTIGVMELDPSIDTEPSAFYVAFYNRVVNTLNDALELNGSLTVSYDIPEDWGELASDMIGATHTTNGSRGMVPQPLAGDEDKVLKGDGTWGQMAVPVEVGDMTGATATKNGSHGLAPQPLKGDEEKFLKGDGTWGNVVTADMSGATVSAAGSHGLVPAPAAGAQERFLRGDGTWAEASTLNFIDGAVYEAPEKSNGFIILSTNSVNLNSTITNTEITIVNASGVVTATSSNENIITVSAVENNKFTIVGQSNGDAVVNLSVTASADYKAYTTTLPVNVHFKASGVVSLSSNSATLGFRNLTSTVTVTNATGAISVESSDTSVATAVLSGNTITISSVNNTTGNATVTVNVASTDDYLATSDTISVTADFVKTAGSVSLSTTDVTLDSETTSTTVSVLSATGTVSVSSSDISVATASISGDIITINSVNETHGTATITVSVAESTEYLATTTIISVSAEFIRIFGVEWDGLSSPIMSRTDEALNFVDPSPAVNNGSGSSPFDNIMPWSGMKRVMDANCGELVEIPKFWYKLNINDETGFFKLQIADGPVEGFYVSPAHMDRGDGQGERDKVYVGAYHCAGSEAKSISGNDYYPISGGTRKNFRTGIHNLGSDIWQWDIAMLRTIQMLYIVEYANWDSQRMIGYGGSNNNTTSAELNGLTDNMIYHTGTNAVDRTTYGHTRYRYIEDLWGNRFDWVDGIRIENGRIPYIILNPADFSNDTNGINSGFSNSFENGLLMRFGKSNVNNLEWFFWPTQIEESGDTTIVDTYICDRGSIKNNPNRKCLYVGNFGLGSLSRGLFYQVTQEDLDSSYDSSLCSRLMKLPNNS